MANKELREKLKEWRKLQMHEEGLVAAYYVLQNATLEAIVELKPLTNEALLSIRGFGPAKVKKYGKDIFRMVRECADSAAKPKPKPQPETPKKKAWSRVDTRMLKRLHEEGKAVEDIASEMGHPQPLVEAKLQELGPGAQQAAPRPGRKRGAATEDEPAEEPITPAPKDRRKR